MSFKLAHAPSAQCLMREMIHERGALAQVCDLLKQIPSIEQRLDLMSGLSALCAEEASFPWGYYSNSGNILKFKRILDDQILAIKQIRTISRLLAQGLSQENSNISVLNSEVLLEIAARSTQKPQALPDEYAKKIAYTFFARPLTPKVSPSEEQLDAILDEALDELSDDGQAASLKTQQM